MYGISVADSHSIYKKCKSMHSNAVWDQIIATWNEQIGPAKRKSQIKRKISNMQQGSEDK